MKEKTPPIATKGAQRRSTRIVQAVPLVIRWAGSRSKALLEEEAATLSINCHGCQYFSQFRIRKNTKISIQVGADKKDLDASSLHFPARVAWSRKSQRLGGMYQVGVEFDAPQNVWHIKESPEDWNVFSPATKEPSVSLLTEVERLLQFAHAGSHYQLLGLESDAPQAEVKRQFYHLASRFHPDHHMDRPEWTPRLLVLMDSLTTAYKTLSNEESKKRYDLRLGGASGRESSERQKLVEECLEKARECLAIRNFIGSILWLRRAIETEPYSPSHRTMLGRSLAAVPEYRREAAEQFEKAIELDPSHIPAHFQYAQMLEQMKLPWRARPHYLRVLELDVKHFEARERVNHLDAAAPRHTSRPSLLRRLTGRG